ncbi:DUF6918 family protein [Flexivirga caeni]|uniref:Uncharacterized protein n=1 Tax=Flexivirga caeni TaxID=2294115 RepID=A0A3M9MEE9_9MICO|nr:hypothetical protein [Flexivirga caeni]RNI23864.1 hypothetical protein EFY87_06230 [Flexivirga caeni]
MSSLSDTLLAPDRRPAVVADLVSVVNAEVKEKKGVGGVTVKAGYAAVRKVSPSIAASATDRMLPDFATALQPFWDDFGGAGDFGAYLAERGDAAADALLSVTDARAAATDREPLKRAYQGLRGKAKGHVQQALPRIGRVVQQHAS